MVIVSTHTTIDPSASCGRPMVPVVWTSLYGLFFVPFSLCRSCLSPSNPPLAVPTPILVPSDRMCLGVPPFWALERARCPKPSVLAAGARQSALPLDIAARSACFYPHQTRMAGRMLLLTAVGAGGPNSLAWLCATGAPGNLRRRRGALALRGCHPVVLFLTSQLMRFAK